MRHFSRHSDGFPKSRMRMNRFANIDGISPHFNRQRNLADHVARVRADHAAAQHFALAVAS